MSLPPTSPFQAIPPYPLKMRALGGNGLNLMEFDEQHWLNLVLEIRGSESEIRTLVDDLTQEWQEAHGSCVPCQHFASPYLRREISPTERLFDVVRFWAEMGYPLRIQWEGNATGQILRLRAGSVSANSKKHLNATNSMKVLITGASGLLGSFLLKTIPEPVEVIAVVHQAPLASEFKQVQVIQQDLTQPDWSWLEVASPDVVIHTAANSRIDDCEQHPEEAWQVNFTVTEKLANWCQHAGAKLLFTSTDTVYQCLADDPKASFLNESAKCKPLSVYSETKWKAESMVLQASQRFVVVRPSLIYHPLPWPKHSFVSHVIESLRHHQEVPLFTDQVRSPVWVQNLADALWELTTQDLSGVFNLGSPKAYTRWELGEILCQKLKLEASFLRPTLQKEIPGAARPVKIPLDVSLAQASLQTRLMTVEEVLDHVFEK